MSMSWISNKKVSEIHSVESKLYFILYENEMLMLKGWGEKGEKEEERREEKAERKKVKMFGERERNEEKVVEEGGRKYFFRHNLLPGCREVRKEKKGKTF